MGLGVDLWRLAFKFHKHVNEDNEDNACQHGFYNCE